MQTDEGVGVQPVPTDAVTSVDHGHADVGVVDQRVCERHAHGTGADDEVVSLQAARHGAIQSPRAYHRYAVAVAPASAGRVGA